MVDTKSLDVAKPRSLGAEYVCHAIWRQLGLDAVLRRQGISEHVLPLLQALVIERVVEPGSERWTKRWVEELSALYEMSGTPLRHSLQSYYRGTNALYGCKEALERHLADRDRNLFSLEENIVLYDLTNTYFEGWFAGNPKAAYGKSKEKRSDCKLATLGLVVDSEGFAKYSKIYPGNQYEGDTVKNPPPKDVALGDAPKRGFTPGASLLPTSRVALPFSICTNRGRTIPGSNSLHTTLCHSSTDVLRGPLSSPSLFLDSALHLTA